jgi:hypothetical protein
MKSVVLTGTHICRRNFHDDNGKFVALLWIKVEDVEIGGEGLPPEERGCLRILGLEELGRTCQKTKWGDLLAVRGWVADGPLTLELLGASHFAVVASSVEVIRLSTVEKPQIVDDYPDWDDFELFEDE